MCVSRKLLAATMFMAMSGSVPAIAAEPFGEMPGELSANVALTNNYIFRGISQSDEHWALQGGFDWEHESGIYLGTWGSTVDFTDAQVEIDGYGGWAGEFNGIGVDLGAIYYWYPGADGNRNYDYFEVAGSLSYDFEIVEVAAGVNYSPDYFASSEDFWYPYADISVPLPYDFELTAHAGYNDIEDEIAFGVPDYWDYNVGVGYNFYGFDLALQWVDTDLDRNECADGCDQSLVLTVSRSF